MEEQYIQSLSHLEFTARQVVEGFITGLHKSPFHGFSVEFAEHRLYNKGESTRHIDWKLFGRTDKLFVKRYEEETNLRCQILIDSSSSMYFPYDKSGKSMNNKMAFAVYSSAALIYLLNKQRDAVGLTVFSENIELHTPAKSNRVHQKMLFSSLEKLLTSFEPFTSKKTSIASAIHDVADGIHKRSLVLIFSDMFEFDTDYKVFSALQHLKHKKHEVILFHVVDKEHELNFEFDNRPYKFIDMETNEEVKVIPGQVKQQYISQMEKYKKELRIKCAQYKIDLVEADIKGGYKQVLMPYLIKRERLY